MVPAACSSRHQAIAKIDHTAKRDKRKQDRLFQPDAMCSAGLFLQDTSFPYMRAQSHAGLFKENRISEIPALEFDPGADLAVFNCYRAFSANFRSCGDERFFAIDATSGIDLDSFIGDLVHLDFIPDVEGERIGDSHASVNQLDNLMVALWPEFHVFPR